MSKLTPMPANIRVNESMTDYAFRMLAERDELKARLERYESTPTQALKAVMERHHMVFETAQGVSVWSRNRLVLDVDCSSMTAEGITDE